MKSLKNYKDSLDRVLEKYPDVGKYLEKNLLPFPADWPGWYYPKKLLANNCSGKYRSMIPEQGQFHVALNAIEDTVLIFKHFFDKLFFSLFGSTLPKNPRPCQSSLCIIAALLGWLMVRDRVLQKFKLCKPQHPNAQASHAHSQSHSSTGQVNALVQQLSICPTRSNRITCWHFPPQYSQSTLIGRLGSNACTFIALTYCKLYFSSPEPLNSSQPLSNTWIYRVLASILLGNQFYDKAAGNTGQLFGV